MVEEKNPNNEKSVEELSNGKVDDRRDTVKRILALSTVAGTAQWSRPVIESVVLPAHAQTTGEEDEDPGPLLSTLYSVDLSLDASRTDDVQITGEISANIVRRESPSSSGGLFDGLVGTAIAAPNVDDAIANQQIDLLVTLQVNRLFEYYWWETQPSVPWPLPDADGDHGPMDYETGEETVRIETKQVTPNADGTWFAEFSNVTTFNQTTRNFPPEVNYHTNFVTANNTPQANSRTYLVFNAFPLDVSVAFLDQPDVPAASGDTFNPYVSPLSFGALI